MHNTAVSQVDIFRGISFHDLLRKRNSQHALEILKRRNEIVLAVSGNFEKAASEISSIFVEYQKDKRQSHETELPPGATRKTYMRMLSQLGDYSLLWPHLPKIKLEDDSYFKFFCLTLNKYKKNGSEGFTPKTRSSLITASGEYPYGVHTHVNIPGFIRAYNLDRETLVYPLAHGHDLEEEGLRVVNDEDLSEVNSRYLIDKFPDNNLGLQLAVGIPALTESVYEVIESELGSKYLDSSHRVIQEAETYRFAKENFESHGKWFPKLMFKDPMVYGGLATQIQEVCKKLISLSSSGKENLKLSKSELVNLAKCIIKVEIADRMDDMADLDRIVKKESKNDLDYGRFWTMFYSSRMLNMFEKLSETIKENSWEEEFNPALQGYIDILEIKLNEISEELEKHKKEPLTLNELLDFYEKEFKPIQTTVDLASKEFIKRKSERILNVLAC